MHGGVAVASLKASQPLLGHTHRSPCISCAYIIVCKTYLVHVPVQGSVPAAPTMLHCMKSRSCLLRSLLYVSSIQQMFTITARYVSRSGFYRTTLKRLLLNMHASEDCKAGSDHQILILLTWPAKTQHWPARTSSVPV